VTLQLQMLARPLFLPTLSLLTFLSLTALEALLVLSIGSHQQAVGSVVLREFVTVSQCAAVTDTQSVQQRTAGTEANGSVINQA